MRNVGVVTSSGKSGEKKVCKRRPLKYYLQTRLVSAANREIISEMTDGHGKQIHDSCFDALQKSKMFSRTSRNFTSTHEICIVLLHEETETAAEQALLRAGTPQLDMRKWSRRSFGNCGVPVSRRENESEWASETLP